MINFNKDKLILMFGPKCTAINVNGELTEFINIPARQMKFCEVVNQSFKVPIRLNADNLGCPGTRRNTGFKSNYFIWMSRIKGIRRSREDEIIMGLPFSVTENLLHYCDNYLTI